MVTMEEYFPFITKAFDVMQYTAWAVLFLIVVWQLFRAFGGPITEAENPWQLVVRGAIFALLIGYAKPIFMLALDIARAPYTALMDVSMTAEEFTFAGVEQVLSKITYGEAIQKMANALKMTLYGTLGNGQMVPLTDAELIAFVNAQSCSPMRKHILTTALSLVGKVPYFWGGKSAPGWNDAWNTPRLVTSAGSPTTGTIRPFGLDCSGFTTWVFNTAVGVEIGAGCNGQYPNTYGISAAELLPGDLGFLADDDGWGHVLIFAGYDAEGTRMWVHSSGGIGVILNTPSYEGRLSYRRLSIVDYDAPVVNSPNGEALYTLEVEVTHYCACAKCCGSNAQGLTASGKQAAVGMVAMSSHYPFGTQIMINGTMYTVEDRGGSGIENNIHRVDIYVPDHQQALRMGRYTTTATIYRLGR